ncbi:hypothetical protein [Streptomyces sp. NPDC048350]|uniref:hypothetical protein n=1 Tax=Streptomyces sp. NPDC048350 TaxID=3365538 RepID=UPI003713A591
MPEPTPEQLEAGAAHGLTPPMCAYLRGETPEELSADAVAFLAAFGQPAPPAPRSGGNRGPDVSSRGASGSVSAGAALYRERHGLDDESKRPDKPPARTRNPFAENGYRMENR